jgi:hypothetical protein
MRKVLFILAITGLTGAASAQYGGGGWQFVGAKAVGHGTDNDIIFVNSDRKFRQLRVCVKKAPVRFEDFDVYYRNGGSENISVREKFKAGSCSRNLDLRGEARHITQIRLRYERFKPNSKKPLVTITGR